MINSMEQPNTISKETAIEQQSLATEIQDVMGQVRSLGKKLGDNNSPKFEVIDIDDERPKFWVYAGKNCIFEVDKSVLKQLEVGKLTDVETVSGKTVSKETIIDHLQRNIDWAKRNIEYTLSYTE